MTEKQPRLSINLNPEAVAFLGDMTTRHGTTYTEEVRRALSFFKLHEDAVAAGGTGLEIENARTGRIQQIVMI